jgi:hypothetical protein
MKHTVMAALVAAMVPLLAQAQEGDSPPPAPSPPPQEVPARKPLASDQQAEDPTAWLERQAQLREAQEARRLERRPRRRTFSIGTAGGGGLIGLTSLGGYGAAGGVVGTLPTLELRAFTENGTSIDFSIPLGDMVRGLIPVSGTFAPSFSSDVFVNFSPEVTEGVRLMLGPGVGGSVGVLSLGQFGYASAMFVGGGFRLGAEVGVEFLAAEGLVSVALLARPSAGLMFVGGGYGSSGAFFTGGLMGLASLSINTRSSAD